MHKKMQHLSFVCRERGDPESARRAIGRAQCNDAYWHGVFGGLYLPHLRHAIWHQLSLAEQELRRGEPLGYEWLDFDGDGEHELWIHSPAFSALLSPARGGVVEEYSVFDQGRNYADVLTRRREAYHERAVEAAEEARRPDTGGTPSIHDLEHSVTLAALPPVDLENRALFVDRILAGALRFDEYAKGTYRPVRSWARAPVEAEVMVAADAIEVVCRPRNAEDRALIEKRLRFDTKGGIRVGYQWNPAGLPADAVFATEISLGHRLQLKLSPDTPAWTFAIQTVAKSERGLDETLQGESVTPRWPIAVGKATVEIVVPPRVSGE
jgi:alpha-amylase